MELLLEFLSEELPEALFPESPALPELPLPDDLPPRDLPEPPGFFVFILPLLPDGSAAGAEVGVGIGVGSFKPVPVPSPFPPLLILHLTYHKDLFFRLSDADKPPVHNTPVL